VINLPSLSGVYAGTKVAIKKMNREKMTEKDLEAFQTEAKLMKSLPAHPNIVLYVTH
jgi:hypothetical protein